MAILSVYDKDGNRIDIPAIKGPQGEQGIDGKDGITPHIDENGNWFIGEVDTGMPSRGEPGSTGPSGIHVGPEPPTDPTVYVWVNPDSDDVVDELPAGPAGEDGGYYTPAVTQTEPGKAEFSWTASKEGMSDIAPQSITLPQGEPGADGKEGPQGEPGADGKSAYQYALDGGYTGTEEEFAEKLAADIPNFSAVGTTKVLEIELTESVNQIAHALSAEQTEKIRNARFLFMDVDVYPAPEDTGTTGYGNYTVNIGSSAERLYLALNVPGIPAFDWNSTVHAQFVYIPKWDFNSNIPRQTRAMMLQGVNVSNGGGAPIKAVIMDLDWVSRVVVAGEPFNVEADRLMGPGSKFTISV